MSMVPFVGVFFLSNFFSEFLNVFVGVVSGQSFVGVSPSLRVRFFLSNFLYQFLSLSFSNFCVGVRVGRVVVLSSEFSFTFLVGVRVSPMSSMSPVSSISEVSEVSDVSLSEPSVSEVRLVVPRGYKFWSLPVPNSDWFFSSSDGFGVGDWFNSRFNYSRKFSVVSPFPVTESPRVGWFSDRFFDFLASVLVLDLYLSLLTTT